MNNILFGKNNNKYILLILLLYLTITGCTSFTLLKPDYPSVGNPNKSPEQTNSLQPTLRWEPAPDSNAAYDLILYECKVDESFWEGIKRTVGDQVYYRESIGHPEHTIEIPLKPASEYYWSVRVRRGNETTEWSRYDYTMFLVFSYMKVSGAYFRFRTPGIE